MISTVYSRIAHAAHYGYSHPAVGHDLEQWDVASADRPEVARRGTDVPADAEYHSGYVDAAGRQHWVYVRRAPLSGPPCVRCARRAS